MNPGWADLVARIAGASTRLLGRARLVALAQARDFVRLATGIEEAYGPSFQAIAGGSPEQLEISVRRVAAGHLKTLARWGFGRTPLLAPIFLDEDRRSVRVLLRGAVAQAPPGERLGALVPTPTLPERALEELARQESPGGVAALLSAWNHRFGRPLLAVAREPRPDLLRLDALLNSTYIAASMSAVQHAARADGARRELAGFVGDTADLENAATALLLAGQSASVAPETLFLSHGRRLSRQTFLAAADAADRGVAQSIIARAFRGSPLGAAFSASDPFNFDDAVLSARLRRTIQSARRFPLGPAPVIAFVMRLRAELRDVCLIIWRLAAAGPPLPARAILSVQ